MLQFTNSSYVLYQILPDHKKIDFLNRAFESDIAKLSQEIYQNHFRSVLTTSEKTEIGIISYDTPEGERVNVFFHGDMMHINCNKLRPLRELVNTAFHDGSILIRDRSLKKTTENRERYHMRYYRAYVNLNYDHYQYPISIS